ncbi:MAG: hypothetical protein FWD05_09735 [Oscillospiraceae bacterium]|nr:hypothetical protein [Oscillospiraceae bacterium]
MYFENFQRYLLKENMWCGGDEFEDYLKAVFGLRCIGIRPTYSNPRIKSQQGLFMLFGIGYDLSNPTYDKYFPINQPPAFDKTNEIAKVIIPKESKDKILNQLKRIGFDKSRIFPELENVADYLKNDLPKIKSGVQK